LARHSRKRRGSGARPSRAGPAARNASRREKADLRPAGATDAARNATRRDKADLRSAGATDGPRAPVASSEPTLSRSQRRDADARAALAPLAPGERPTAITVGAGLAVLVGGANLIAFAAGAKIGGKQPAAGGVIVFALLMFACAVGLWRLWYGAVLAFMALLAIITMLFALLLIEASNLLGFLVPPVVIAGAGYLFYKLVRVLGRIQMPSHPGDSQSR
jgi:hypothetical protein